MRKVTIVVPVLITSCQVSLNPKSGPVTDHTTIIPTAIMNVAGLPVIVDIQRAIRPKLPLLRSLFIMTFEPLDYLEDRVHVVFKILVAIDKRHAFPDLRINPASSFPKLLVIADRSLPKIYCLCGAEKFQSKYLFKIFRNLSELERRGRPHRDVVLDIR